LKTINSKLKSKTFHVTIVALLFCVSYSYSQKPPPKDLVTRIDNTQNLQFGTFISTGSAGGTVEVSWDGKTRTSTGDIVLLGNNFQPAIFVVTLDGSLSQITNNALTISYFNYALNAVSGGSQLPLDAAGPAGPLPNRNVGNYVRTGVNQYTTTITVGALLTIPPGAISDTYTGSFDIRVTNQ
jgi:hypothetical protein